MTILIELLTGNQPERRIYRNVAPHNYGAYVAGFYANREQYPGGIMYHLKGDKRKVLHTFGGVSNGRP